MIITLRKCFFLLVAHHLFFSICELNGQTPFYINYDTKDGLPSSEIYDIHFTKDRRAWLTTDRGVSVYDGYEFSNFYTKHGLYNNTNFRIFEDSQNRLWFTGLDASMSLFVDGAFVQKKETELLKQSIPNGFFNAPIEDEAGNLLFFNRGVDFDEKPFFLLGKTEHELSTLTFEDLQDRYSFKTTPHLTIVQVNPKVAIPFSQEYDLLEPLRKYGDYWLGFGSYRLYKFDDEARLVEQKGMAATVDVTRCYIDQLGHLWVCTYDGLFFFRNGDLNEEPERYFSNLTVTDLKQDFEGNFWMSTLESGLFFIPSFQMNAIGYWDEPLNCGRILLAESLEQHVCFATSREWTFCVDQEMNLEILSTSNTQFPSCNCAMNEGARRCFFFHNHLLEGKDGSKPQIHANNRFGGAGIFERLKNGNYFSARGNRIHIVKEDGGSVHKASFEGFSAVRVESIEEGKEGNIWLGTQEGLLKISGPDYQQISDASAQESALKGRINDIEKDAYDNLWIATLGNGLVYKTASQQFVVDESNGLHSNLVNCVLVEDEHTIWLGTNLGLNRLEYDWVGERLKVKQVSKFGVLDGLPSNFINDIVLWNDYLWLATNKGVGFIHPKALKKNRPIVPIYLENFFVNGEARKFQEQSVLEPNENDVFFQLTGISYRKQEVEGFYRYRLFGKGTEEKTHDWIYTNDRNVRFIDLAQGQYTFEAAAKNKSNQWSDPGVQLNFEIQPYLWQTLWFKVLMLLLFFFLLSSAIFLRERQMTQRNVLHQNLLEARMQAKEYELSSLRNQMNPHFVFNALNAIQNFIFKKDSRKANYYLSIFSRLMRDSLKFSRLKYISLEEELNFLQTYLELEQMRFPDRFDYTIRIAPGIHPRQFTIPALLFQPILENAVKHAFKEIDYKGWLEIELKEVIPGKTLGVRIQDNGSGLKKGALSGKRQDHRHESLGLTIVKNQIDLLNTNQTEEVASIQIVNLVEIDDQLSGVRIDLKVPMKSVLQASLKVSVE